MISSFSISAIVSKERAQNGLRQRESELAFSIRAAARGLCASRTVARAAIAALVAPSMLPAASDGLKDVLNRSARMSESFLERVAGVTCVESAEQRKFDSRNRLLSRHDGQYGYVLLLQITPDRLFADESRELRGKPGKRPAQPLLDTAGFAVLSLIFHPHLQSSYRFTELPVPEGDAPRPVAFEHIRGQRSPSVLETPTGSIPIEWKGQAWIDPTTGFITRIHAEWAGPGEGHALQHLSAKVEYLPVAFRNPEETFWLPKSADIEVKTARSRWLNHHVYSVYSRFSVTTEVRLGEVK